ncbi:MAG: hypothetical protein M1821_005324 [Bathelium mastoideum]|nr:MAG: hypothetical protein M1821_005324 [Bathelium mastoideum]
MTSHPGLLLPLCTSSASLALSAFQFPLFLAFLPKHPSPSHHNSSRSTKPTSSASLTGRPLSHFWARFLVPGAGLVVACAATSTLAGALSARWLAQHGHLETTEVA